MLLLGGCFRKRRRPRSPSRPPLPPPQGIHFSVTTPAIPRERRAMVHPGPRLPPRAAQSDRTAAATRREEIEMKVISGPRYGNVTSARRNTNPPPLVRAQQATPQGPRPKPVGPEREDWEAARRVRARTFSTFPHPSAHPTGPREQSEKSTAPATNIPVDPLALTHPPPGRRRARTQNDVRKVQFDLPGSSRRVPKSHTDSELVACNSRATSRDRSRVPARPEVPPPVPPIPTEPRPAARQPSTPGRTADPSPSRPVDPPPYAPAWTGREGSASPGGRLSDHLVQPQPRSGTQLRREEGQRRAHNGASEISPRLTRSFDGPPVKPQSPHRPLVTQASTPQAAGDDTSMYPSPLRLTPKTSPVRPESQKAKIKAQTAEKSPSLSPEANRTPGPAPLRLETETTTSPKSERRKVLPPIRIPSPEEVSPLLPTIQRQEARGGTRARIERWQGSPSTSVYQLSSSPAAGSATTPTPRRLHIPEAFRAAERGREVGNSPSTPYLPRTPNTPDGTIGRSGGVRISQLVNALQQASSSNSGSPGQSPAGGRRAGIPASERAVIPILPAHTGPAGLQVKAGNAAPPPIRIPRSRTASETSGLNPEFMQRLEQTLSGGLESRRGSQSGNGAGSGRGTQGTREGEEGAGKKGEGAVRRQKQNASGPERAALEEHLRKQVEGALKPSNYQAPYAETVTRSTGSPEPRSPVDAGPGHHFF